MDKPLVRAVALFCLGIVLGRLFPVLGGLAPRLCAAAAISAALVLFLRRVFPGPVSRLAWYVSLALLAVALGIFRHALALRIPPGDILHRLSPAPVRLSGVVADFPRIERHNVTFILDCREIVVGEKREKATGRVEASLRGAARGMEDVVARGNRLEIFARLSRPEERGNPGESSSRERLAAEGIRLEANLYDPRDIALLQKASSFSAAGLLERIRRRLEESIRLSLPSPGGAPGSIASVLLEGLILGAKGRVPFQIRENFREIGVIHVLVVSGLHVGFIFYLSSLLFSPLPLRWRSGLAIPLVLLYVSITGANSPAARAGLMATAVSLACVFNQPRNIWTAIAFSALCLLLINPLCLFQPGFQLSYLIVLSIIALAPAISSLLVFLPPRLRPWLAVPLAAQLGSLPLTAHYFQAISPLSLFANILIIPLIGLIVSAGFLALLLGFLSPSLAVLLNYPNRFLLALVLAIVSFLSRLPFASFPASFASPPFVLAWYLFLLALSRLTFFTARRKLACAVGAGILLLGGGGAYLPGRSSGFEAVFFNGESGNFAFVSLPGGQGILIASDDDPFGETEKILRPFFRARGITRLDLLILTQANPDHLRTLAGLLRFAEVEEIWDHPLAASALSSAAFLRRVREEGIRYRTIRAGDRLGIGAGEIAVLWPTAAPAGGFTPDLSLVFSLSFRKIQVLFPSQAGTAAQREILRLHPELRAEVLLAPARGGRARAFDPFLKAVSPRVAVIAQGKKYFGKYPADCGDYLAALGAEVHRTGVEGCVIVRSDGEKAWVIERE